MNPHEFAGKYLSEYQIKGEEIIPLYCPFCKGGKAGKDKRPFMVHRALLGSIERFFGVLLEHYAGAFPPWLAYEQIRIIPVAAPFEEYARKLQQLFRDQDLRASADLSDDRMNAKIRKAQKEKIPYMVIVGEREEQEQAVSVRYRNGKQENGISLDDFLQMVGNHVAEKIQL